MASLLRRVVSTTLRVPQHVRTSIGGIRTNMMDTANFTDEQIALRDAIRAFADAELAPQAGVIDATNNFEDIRGFWRKLGDMGLLGITAP
eukprot:gene10832-27439_t